MSAASKPTDLMEALARSLKVPVGPRLLPTKRLAEIRTKVQDRNKDPFWAERYLPNAGASGNSFNLIHSDMRALIRHIDALTDQLAEAAKREQALREEVHAGHQVTCTHGACVLCCNRCGQGRAALEASSGSASSEREGPLTRNPLCVERWPECHTGGYDPACCRFPKSCSCTVDHSRP